MRKILLVSQAPESYAPLVRILEVSGAQVVSQASLPAAVALLRDPAHAVAAIVLDVELFSSSDFDLLASLALQYPEVQKMVFASSASLGEVLHRIQSGSDIHVFSTPIEGHFWTCGTGTNATSPEMILQAITETTHTQTGLARKVQSQTSARPIPGRSARNRRAEENEPLAVDEFLYRVGVSDAPVLLHGETGAGKEVMARRLWSYSCRRNKPFLKLNCAALPSELIESELFGYEKGAFTGALVDKPGKFELAQDGTVLLDEIGDMDTRLQAKLLQVLQDGEVQPLGSGRTIRVNVRIMAATHRDLQAAIAQGTFREDLYYRLSVINITIPPLRERRDEIIALAEQLLLRHVGAGVAAPAIPEVLRRALLAHPWPGNVRELENVMRRYLVYQDAGVLAAELTDPFNAPRPRLAMARAPLPVHEANNERVSFDHFTEASRTAESKLLLETLESVRWNRRQAALQLNIDYKALLYKLQKHGIVESKAKRREVSA